MRHVISPALVHAGADSRIVNGADGAHGGFRQRRQVRSGAVIGHLIGALAAGDGAGDGIKLEDPAQSELRQAGSLRRQRTQLFDGFERGRVIDAGEGFADVERLAVPVEVTVVVGSELGIARELAREQGR